ncbi:MAG: hypothetical protein ACOX2S_04285 [bacterium]
MKDSDSKLAVWRNGFRVALLTFGLSLVIGSLSTVVVRAVPLFLAFIVLLAIIALGIIFDIMGVAVTAAQEPPLHAMSAKRVPGAKQAIRLIRNAPGVSNFCNDVIGDIAGTISGATGATIVFYLSRQYPFLREDLLSLVLIAVVSALTVGGKAIGKHYSINEATRITFQMGKVFAFLERIHRTELLKARNNSRR